MPFVHNPNNDHIELKPLPPECLRAWIITDAIRLKYQDQGIDTNTPAMANVIRTTRERILQDIEKEGAPMYIEVIVTGTKEGQEETTETYNIQLPMDAEGTDAVSYLNNVLQWALGVGPKYVAVSHFKISGTHTYKKTRGRM